VSEKCPNKTSRRVKKLKVTSQSYNHLSNFTKKVISCVTFKSASGFIQGQ